MQRSRGRVVAIWETLWTFEKGGNERKCRGHRGRKTCLYNMYVHTELYREVLEFQYDI